VIFENDGDLHIIMKNADHRTDRIVVEAPSDACWCPIRQAVCLWTNAKFPFQTDAQWGFYVLRHPVVTVIGKAFYDIDHSGRKPRKNRRNYDLSLAVWDGDEAGAKRPLSWRRFGDLRISASLN
jgi:hypothetical protein